MIKDLPARLRTQAGNVAIDGHESASRLMGEAAAEIEILRGALKLAEKADRKAINCQNHEPDMAPEACEKCFMSADRARTARWSALGLDKTEPMTC